MAADLEISVGADFAELKTEVDRAKAKLRELGNENVLLKQEVKDASEALRRSDAAIKKVNDSIAKLKPTTRGSSEELKKLNNELTGLQSQNKTIQQTLLSTQNELKENTRQIRAQEKEVVKLTNAKNKWAAGAGKAYRGLRLLANIIPGLGVAGLVSIIAGPLISAFGEWVGLTGAAAEKAKKLQEATDKVIGSLSEEVSQVTQLVGVASSDVASREQRYAAIKKLQEIAPQYFGTLDAEKAKIIDLNRAYEAYLGSLKARIRLEVNKESLTTNLKDQISLEDKITKEQEKQAANQTKIESLRKKAQEAFKRGAVSTYDSLNAQIAGLQTGGVLDKMKRELSDLKKEAKDLLGNISSGTSFTGVQDTFDKLKESIKKLSVEEVTFKTDKGQEKVTAIRNAIVQLRNEFGLTPDNALIKYLEQWADRIPVVEKNTRSASGAIKGFAKDALTVEKVLTDMNATLSNTNVLEKTFGDDRTAEKVKAITSAITDLVTKLNIPFDSDLIAGLKKQIADLETTQKIDVELQPNLIVDYSKLSDNSKIINEFDKERQDLIKKLKKLGFDRLPTGLAFDKADKKELQAFWDDITASIANTAATITDILSPAFDNVFDAIMQGGDVFEALKQSIQQIVSELAKAAIKAAIFAAIINAVSGGTVSFGSAFTKALGFADGGYVSGPGSSRSDSIPARLSNGEYVIQASRVKQFGKGFFDALNFAGRMPLRSPNAFANGGFVGNTVSAVSLGGVNVTGQFELRNNVLYAAVKRGEAQNKRFS